VSVGSGRWIGKEVYRHIVEAIDGRGPKTNLQEFIFKKFNIKGVDEFIDFIYENPAVNLPKFSIVCNEAAMAGDKVSREIIVEAGKNVARSVIVTARQLDFNDGKIPTVITGGVFNSKFFYESFIDSLKKADDLDFSLIRCEAPVIGAVKMAIDNI
jgi:N-acetylglucosamine kinase-like BadF-type ATPase